MTASALRALGGARVVPVVVVDDAANAASLGDALAEGGLRCAEVTFRTTASEAALRAMALKGSITVGAGTVTTPGQVDRAVDAGAQFIVSPGLATDVVERALTLNIPIFPGIATASELQAASRLGLRVVKLFPAELLGGIAAVRALAGPFPGMLFLPSGGILADTAADYLEHPSVVAVGGSWMVPRNAITAGDFDTIRRLSAETARRFETSPEGDTL